MHGSLTRWYRTVDVSKGALFFETEERFDVRSLLRMQFDACGQAVDAWGFVVRRGVCRGARGVAVRFCVQSDLMSRLWERFLEELDRSYRRRTYVIRPRDPARLIELEKRHLIHRQPYRMYTGLVREEGSDVELRIDHPSTGQSYLLPASVLKAWRGRPTGMDVALRPPPELDHFHHFVETGTLAPPRATPALPRWLLLGSNQYALST